mmetsp:Transcript_16318/g.56995  ORF Transcript_16318/g.56995 Transcript_16318/m.56995 type:complete len:377 (+) Transcript_16318:236-1366(+)
MRLRKGQGRQRGAFDFDGDVCGGAAARQRTRAARACERVLGVCNRRDFTPRQRRPRRRRRGALVPKSGAKAAGHEAGAPRPRARHLGLWREEGSAARALRRPRPKSHRRRFALPARRVGRHRRGAEPRAGPPRFFSVLFGHFAAHGCRGFENASECFAQDRVGVRAPRHSRRAALRVRVARARARHAETRAAAEAGLVAGLDVFRRRRRAFRALCGARAARFAAHGRLPGLRARQPPLELFEGAVPRPRALPRRLNRVSQGQQTPKAKGDYGGEPRLVVRHRRRAARGTAARGGAADHRRRGRARAEARGQGGARVRHAAGGRRGRRHRGARRRFRRRAAVRGGAATVPDAAARPSRPRLRRVGLREYGRPRRRTR